MQPSTFLRGRDVPGLRNRFGSRAVRLQAAGLPRIQPKTPLTIIREQVKIGRSAAHSKFESEYPAAFEKAGSPDYYLALTSLTGPSEAWYLVSARFAPGHRRVHEART